MNENDFIGFAEEIAKANGLDEDTALEYAALVGDTPEFADDGKVIVRSSHGHEIARIIWPD